jgi:hypothetical protein
MSILIRPPHSPLYSTIKKFFLFRITGRSRWAQGAWRVHPRSWNDLESGATFPTMACLGSRMISSTRGPVELGRRASPEIAAAAPNGGRARGTCAGERSARHRAMAKGHRGIQADEPKQTKSTIAVKRQKNAGAGKGQDPADAAGELDWGCPRLPSMPDAGLARKLAGARVPSVSGARPRSLGRGSCARRRSHTQST